MNPFLLNFLRNILVYSIILLICPLKTRETGGITVDDIIPTSYDYLHPPKNETNPVLVQIHLDKIHIRSIDESDMSFAVILELWQIWTDHRLTFPSWALSRHTILDSTWIDKLWSPKLYFMNAVDGKLDNIISPSSFFWISNRSSIIYRCRVNLNLICEMDLRYFPHDQQECGIQMASAVYPTNDVYLNWSHTRRQPQLFTLQQFDVFDLSKSSFLKSWGSQEISCLELTVQLHRRTGYYLINVYIPTILIVIMSMLTFWIPHDAVPARVTLGVTSLLTIITKQYQASMPNVSYIVALNVWISSCIAFVFFSLVEYAAVIAISTEKRRGRDLQCSSDSVLPMLLLRRNGTWCAKNNWAQSKTEKENLGARRLDYLSRAFFPVSFIVFCIIYWKYFN